LKFIVLFLSSSSFSTNFLTYDEYSPSRIVFKRLKRGAIKLCIPVYHSKQKIRGLNDPWVWLPNMFLLGLVLKISACCLMKATSGIKPKFCIYILNGPENQMKRDTKLLENLFNQLKNIQNEPSTFLSTLLDTYERLKCLKLMNSYSIPFFFHFIQFMFSH